MAFLEAYPRQCCFRQIQKEAPYAHRWPAVCWHWRPWLLSLKHRQGHRDHSHRSLMAILVRNCSYSQIPLATPNSCSLRQAVSSASALDRITFPRPVHRNHTSDSKLHRTQYRQPEQSRTKQSNLHFWFGASRNVKPGLACPASLTILTLPTGKKIKGVHEHLRICSTSRG